jgi:hypothetical protein
MILSLELDRSRLLLIFRACESWPVGIGRFGAGAGQGGCWWRQVTLTVPDRLVACLTNDLSLVLPAPAWLPSLA